MNDVSADRRPYVVLSVAMSIDGHIDDRGPERLLLSSPEDFDRVDQLRADSDAVLVGAGTLRSDDPRLLVASPERRAEREARGLPAYPLKVALTGSGDLDPALRFWHHGGAKVAYAPDTAAAKLAERLDGLADVVGTGAALDPGAVLDDLGARGVGRLMVEGGGAVHTLFLTAGLVDEIQLAVAPFFVGDDAAPRFVLAGAFPQDPRHRMTLAETRMLGDTALLRYLVRRPPLTAADRHWLAEAVEESRRCPPSVTAYSVGAIIVAEDGTELARGHSREQGDPAVHAEEAALAKLDPADPRLATATLYSTLEPCSRRSSHPVPCAQLVRASALRRVVIAWREPALFVADCEGVELLEQAGITVLECPELAPAARAVNSYLELG
ncbi:dihydrofolate reductase family protein [Streptacidiphilus sp. N1-12]|uniref:Dihydrofolate reductase family protein n=2 Tax=Streptacidiphilus alkalitolerans TaxID=3342712 RepID=A0ABV6V815_9ACTN